MSPVGRVPTKKPQFTLGDIRKSTPPYCFQRSVLRSVLRSFSYIIPDLTAACLLHYAAVNYITFILRPLTYFIWPIYSILQGCIFFSIWVIAHECGHHAFSDYQWLDDTVGFILHSCLLVPYFSWKYSHSRHHSNVASIEKDEVFVPRTKDNSTWTFTYLNNPFGRFLALFVSLTLGWPLYLLINVSGRNYNRFASHYDPFGPIFFDRESVQVFISDTGILAACYGLFRLYMVNGLLWILRVYGGPLIVTNALLVLLTFLHHTHQSLPHYDSSEWDWLRGALSTVDRDYGVFNTVFHNITNTHVVHHLFSTMPHYHALEATKAIKPILGKYYFFDDTSIFRAMWREIKECVYVAADDDRGRKGVLWYQK